LIASVSSPRPDLSPQRKKERTLEALFRQLEGLRVAAGGDGFRTDQPSSAAVHSPSLRNVGAEWE
jgi:hypothetical protein